MQRQDYSQATSTLGNTPSLNIGFIHQKEAPTLVHQTRITILVPRPKVSFASSNREFCISSADWKSYLASSVFRCSSQARFCKWKFQAAIFLNLHSVSVVHFASIDAYWRKSSISRGFGVLGFCLPCIWIHVLRRSLELPGSIAPFLQVSSTCADNARLLTKHQVKLFHLFKSNNFLGWHFCSH